MAQDSASVARGKHVVVVGGGMAGLAVTYHLLNQTRGDASPLRITIVDSHQVGCGGATAAMAGLLHPCNPRGKKMWSGDAGMRSSLSLIRAAAASAEEGRDPILGSSCAEASSEAVLAAREGVVRLVTKGEKQRKDYHTCAETFPEEVVLVAVEHGAIAAAQGEGGEGTRRGLRGLGEGIQEALLVKDGVALRGGEYAIGLLAAAQAIGQVEWVCRPVRSLREAWEGFGADVVVVAAGAGSGKISELSEALPLQYKRAQNIRYERNASAISDAGLLGAPIISGRYIVPFLNGRTLDGEPGGFLFGGAAQEPQDGGLEGDFRTEPDLEGAMAIVHRALVALYAPLDTDAWIPVGASCGIKAAPPRSSIGQIPYAGRMRGVEHAGEQSWLFAGLGSRGLIHHSVVAERLAAAILADDETAIPQELRRIPLLGSLI